MYFWFKAFRIKMTNLISTRLRAVQLLPFLSVIAIVKLCLSANNGWQPEDRDPAEAIMANWGRSKQTTLQTRGVYQFNRTMVLCIYLCLWTVKIEFYSFKNTKALIYVPSHVILWTIAHANMQVTNWILSITGVLCFPTSVWFCQG